MALIAEVMMRWSREALEQVEQAIGEGLGQQLPKRPDARGGQQFDAGFMLFLAEKLLIPMLVSFFSNVLLDKYRQIKGETSGAIQNDRIAEALNQHPLDLDSSPTPEAMQELRQHLAPLGLTDPQIIAVREVVRTKLKSLTRA